MCPLEHATSFHCVYPSVSLIATLLQEVLLLHEVETLIKFVPPEAYGAVLDVIMPKVGDLPRCALYLRQHQRITGLA